MNVKVRGRSKKERYRILKRFLDIVFSSLLLFFLFIPMMVIGIIIRITSDGKAIFRQERIGRNEKPFVCLKFRTMYVTAPRDCPTAQFSDAQRYITGIGKFLRRTSLDELPQLWNVLVGEMSLVGPRPLIPCESKIHEFRKRGGVYDIRPGITGLAQINGRDILDDKQKARLDIRYSKNMKLSTDVRIIMRTIGRAVTGDGITFGRSVSKNGYINY